MSLKTSARNRAQGARGPATAASATSGMRTNSRGGMKPAVPLWNSGWALINAAKETATAQMTTSQPAGLKPSEPPR